ncbi:choline ABC transporter ATP-binding protein [Zestomonas carbonaria]|uniref:Glycine betaine/choline transport system ATP-binding protein OusV n=1 Tax=Zestomonas carbonaria TaxID=2762745 RepID=A0A7U7ELH0_9GAMM|nr:choline ABC transporter ATP-binding protein [Pseudomonas carbonaria]CAD5107041.1 Glycine betaine/choline transport system ATP-binding protein OusV [Pseudomonas carbonaria]
MSLIRFDRVDLVFVKSPKRALKLLDEGLSRDAIFARSGQLVAVAGASLAVERGETCVLMGLSGSGKSSLLRCVNGLNRISRGHLWIEHEGRPLDLAACNRAELKALRTRRIAMVFQQFALLPWLTVAENIGFGLELQGMAAAERHQRVTDKLELVGLGPWRDKRPDELSGGMQQRVGLARALAMDADILLMDEPFSALDPLIRQQLQDELLDLQRRLHKTIVFVSHDLDEALKLGNRIAIMKDGRIVQHGRPEDILLNPADDYVRNFVAHTNPLDVLSGRSLMRPLADCHDGAGEICLDREQDCWLGLASDQRPLGARRGDQPLELQQWTPGQPLSELLPQPTLVDARIVMRDALQVRYRTRHPLVLQEQGRIVGLLDDHELYHALLGQPA